MRSPLNNPSQTFTSDNLVVGVSSAAIREVHCGAQCTYSLTYVPRHDDTFLEASLTPKEADSLVCCKYPMALQPGKSDIIQIGTGL